MTSFLSNQIRYFAVIVFSIMIALAGSGTESAAAEDKEPKFVIHDSPKPLPKVSFLDATGKAMDLSFFLDKFVVLNIWATWCPPCRKEMPTLDNLQAQLGNDSFEVVALSIDRTGIEKVQKFFKEIGVKHLTLYIDSSGQASRTLKAFGLPVTILIDRKGYEIGRLIGPAEWDTPEMISFIREKMNSSQISGQSTSRNE